MWWGIEDRVSSPESRVLGLRDEESRVGELKRGREEVCWSGGACLDERPSSAKFV